MFLLVPAHPGCSGQNPQSRKNGCVCVCIHPVCLRSVQITHLTAFHLTSSQLTLFCLNWVHCDWSQPQQVVHFTLHSLKNVGPEFSTDWTQNCAIFFLTLQRVGKFCTMKPLPLSTILVFSGRLVVLTSHRVCKPAYLVPVSSQDKLVGFCKKGHSA